MGRRNLPEPSFPSPEFTGRKCYRLPGEPWDERPCLLIAPFWANDAEETAYTMAVRNNPKGATEGAGTYIARIAGIVARGPLGPAAKSFPPPHRMNREYRGPRPETSEPTPEERVEAIMNPPREPGEDDE